MDNAGLIAYLRAHDLKLATAESCTAGTIFSQLADIEGSGELMDCGYVVYSPDAKKRVLGVRQETLDAFTLTSEEVVREMAAGALRISDANVAIATTGLAGPEAKDGIAPGTVCIAWAFERAGEIVVYSRTRHFPGDRPRVRQLAALYAIDQLRPFHRQLQHGADER